MNLRERTFILGREHPVVCTSSDETAIASTEAVTTVAETATTVAETTELVCRLRSWAGISLATGARGRPWGSISTAPTSGS